MFVFENVDGNNQGCIQPFPRCKSSLHDSVKVANNTRN